MPPDPKSREIGRWLEHVRIDLRAAEVDIATDPILLGDAAFHCQQAVEKAYKALLTYYDHPFGKSHNLDELGAACREHEPSLEPLTIRAARLTAYAWRFRYPAHVAMPTRAAVEEALEVARAVVRAVEDAVAGAC